MADSNPSGTPVQSGDNLEASRRDEKDIKKVFSAGLQVMMSSFLLDRLLMVLSIVTVHINGGEQVGVEKKVKEVMEKCTPYKELLKTQGGMLRYWWNLLTGDMDLKSDSEKQKLKENTLGLETEIKKFREKKTYPESVLLKEAFEDACSNTDPRLETVCLKLKIGIVHEIYGSLGVGWRGFKDGSLLPFKDVKDIKNNSVDETFYGLVELLSKSRNVSAHSHDLDKDEDIAKFQKRFDKVITLLEPFFKPADPKGPADRKWRIRSLFPSISLVFTDDLLHNTRLRSCHQNLSEILKNRSQTALDVKNLKEARKQKNELVWSAIIAYHDAENNPDQVYKHLLKCIDNPQQFLEQLREDDNSELINKMKELCKELSSTSPEAAGQAAGPSTAQQNREKSDSDTDDDLGVTQKEVGHPSDQAKDDDNDGCGDGNDEDGGDEDV